MGGTALGIARCWAGLPHTPPPPPISAACCLVTTYYGHDWLGWLVGRFPLFPPPPPPPRPRTGGRVVHLHYHTRTVAGGSGTGYHAQTSLPERAAGVIYPHPAAAFDRRLTRAAYRRNSCITRSTYSPSLRTAPRAVCLPRLTHRTLRQDASGRRRFDWPFIRRHLLDGLVV